MGYCAALNCRNGTSGPYKNTSVSFYGFPLQNKPLLWQWIQNMGRDMDTPSKYQCLCSEHFEESSFEVDPLRSRKRRRLLKEAVPNKFILGEDGTWLVGTPQGDATSSKTRKRIRNSESWRVSGMFPVWPRLQDWQNEFYKLLLKEKFGSLITLGKDCPVGKSHVPAGGAAQVKDLQDLEGRKIPASLSTGHGGAMIQGAGGTQLQGSPSGTSQILIQGAGGTQLHGSSLGTSQALIQGAGVTQLHGSPSGTSQILIPGAGGTQLHGSPSGTSQILIQRAGGTQLHGSPSGTSQILIQGAGNTKLHGSPSGTSQTLIQGAGATQLHGSSLGTSQALIPGAGGTQLHGSPSGTSQTLHCHTSNQAGTSGSRHNLPTNPPTNPATNPTNPTRIRSSNSILAGHELDEFRRFLLYHQGHPEEVTVPWFICAECGKSFARHSYLLRHQRTHTGQPPLPRRNPPSTDTPAGISTSSTGHRPAWGTAWQEDVKNPALLGAGGL